MAMPIKVLIADDHQIVRDGLRSLLTREPDMELVGEAEDGRTIMKMLLEKTPDVIIMDVAMPELNGIEATRQALHEFPAVKVIALSMHDDRRFVINMLKAGASGYLIKDCAFRELANAIRMVVKNKIYLSPGITDIVVNNYVTGPAPDSLVYSILTPREREVLQLIAEGKNSTQIANCLCVSVKTVETHRHQLMQKLNIKGVAELTKVAIREGITSI
jgi:two-component system response regulator NreC